MSYPVIEVESRMVNGAKLNALRNEGKIPGILYGHNKEYPPQMVQLDEPSFRRQLAQGRKFFQVKGVSDQEIPVFVAEVQVDELTDHLFHVDFQRIKPGDQISIKIPLSAKGTPVGARVGGRLEVFLHELRLEGAPENMLEEYILDVSKLDVGGRVTLESLDLPEGVRPLGSPSTTVCIVHPPKGARGSQQEASEQSPEQQTS